MSLPTAAKPPNAIPLHAFLVIALGVLAVSLASIFINLAQAEGAPSLFIAAARLTIATLVLTPLTFRRYPDFLATLTRSDVILGLASGGFLALHFASWILSFEHTTILVSVVLVNTNSLWAALLEFIFLRQMIRRWVLIGMILGLVGSIIVALPPPETGITFGVNPLLGSALAVIGAIAVAVYYVIGRKLRVKYPLLPYIWLVYGAAAIVLVAAVVLTGTPILGYSWQAYLWIVATALVPQLIGHSSFNYALKYVPASYVGIATQMEPVLSALMAVAVFSQIPTSVQIQGSALILCAVILASVAQARQTAKS